MNESTNTIAYSVRLPSECSKVYNPRVDKLHYSLDLEKEGEIFAYLSFKGRKKHYVCLKTVHR